MKRFLQVVFGIYASIKFLIVSKNSFIKIRGLGVIKTRIKGKVQIGDNFMFNSGLMFNPIGGDHVIRLVVSKNAELIIGSNVGISNSTINVKSKVVIGSDTIIGGGVSIWDSDFHSIQPDSRNSLQFKKAPIVIGRNVWIGGKSIILKGVEIGDNSIVAAGSVVTKSIPSNQVWGGNPAKYISKL